MAEVRKIPKVETSSLIREKSSIDNPTPKQTIQKIEEPKGVVIKKKKSLGVQFKEAFIIEDARDVGDYILWDIIVPSIKRTLHDIMVGCADRIFYGEGSVPSSLYRENGVTRVQPVNYRVISSKKAANTVSSRQNAAPKSRASFDVLDLIFRLEDYDKLCKAFNDMVEYLDTYGQLSVDQYADILSQRFEGVPQPYYTAQEWGWKSLSNASIINVPGGGYTIKMPSPIYLKG